MAERSKAPDLGSGISGCVGSNPTLLTGVVRHAIARSTFFYRLGLIYIAPNTPDSGQWWEYATVILKTRALRAS